MVGVSIGFQASPPLGVRVDEAELERLLGVVGTEGWHDLPTQDGSVRMNLQHVLWVRSERDERGIGFGR